MEYLEISSWELKVFWLEDGLHSLYDFVRY